MNKETIDPDRLYRVRELAEIFRVNYRTALRWIQLGEIDSVKIGRTYLVTGERIQTFKSEVYVVLTSFVVVSRRNLKFF